MLTPALAAYGHVAGQITGSTGAPLPDIYVTIYRFASGAWSGWRSDSTDTTGHYDIGGLTTGIYRVQFQDYSQNYIEEYYDNAADVNSATDVAVTSGETTNVDAVLAAYGHIAGQVTGPTGAPLPDIYVTIYRFTSGAWSFWRSDSTDTTGRYDIGGLTTGTYRVQFQDYSQNYIEEYYDNAADVNSATDVAVTSGETTTVNAALATYGHIAGQVTGPTGTPLPDIYVTIYRFASGAWSGWRSDSTDTTGHYDIGGLTTGTYRVQFQDYSQNYIEEYYDNAADVNSATDVAAASGETTTVNAALAAYGHIAGKVTAADWTTPLSEHSGHSLSTERGRLAIRRLRIYRHCWPV